MHLRKAPYESTRWAKPLKNYDLVLNQRERDVVVLQFVLISRRACDINQFGAVIGFG